MVLLMKIGKGGVCGSFLKMVEDARAMAAGDSSEQQRLLTEMVLAGFKKPQPLFPLGFPKKKRSSFSSSSMLSSNASNSDIIFCQILQDLKSDVDLDQQLIQAAMVLADLKKAEEAAFPLGFPKKKRSLARSRGMRSSIQKPNKRIIIKFKRSAGTASYSLSVSYVDLKPNPLVGDDDQKEGLAKLTIKSNKRCFSEIEEHYGFGERNPKKMRSCGKQLLQHNINSSCFGNWGVLY